MKALLLLIGLALSINISMAEVGEQDGCGGSDLDNCTCINQGTGQEDTVVTPAEDTPASTVGDQ